MAVPKVKFGIQAVFARGRQLVQDGQALVKGRFE